MRGSQIHNWCTLRSTMLAHSGIRNNLYVVGSLPCGPAGIVLFAAKKPVALVAGSCADGVSQERGDVSLNCCSQTVCHSRSLYAAVRKT